MVKETVTNPEVYAVFHYPVFVFAVLPCARTVTSKKAGWGEHHFLSKEL